MGKSKLDEAVDLLTSECVATFEYNLGWNASMFRAPIRSVISSTISELDDRDLFIDRVLCKLSDYEVV